MRISSPRKAIASPAKTAAQRPVNALAAQIIGGLVLDAGNASQESSVDLHTRILKVCALFPLLNSSDLDGLEGSAADPSLGLAPHKYWSRIISRVPQS